MAGAVGKREDEKKFDVEGSPKFIGEGESVAGCDISPNDLLWRWGCGDHISITVACRVQDLLLVLGWCRRYVRLLVVQLVVSPQWAKGRFVLCCIDVGKDVVPSV